MWACVKKIPSSTGAVFGTLKSLLLTEIVQPIQLFGEIRRAFDQPALTGCMVDKRQAGDMPA